MPRLLISRPKQYLGQNLRMCVYMCMFIPGLIFNTWFPASFVLPILLLLLLLLFLLLLLLIVQFTAFVSKGLPASNLKKMM